MTLFSVFRDRVQDSIVGLGSRHVPLFAVGLNLKEIIDHFILSVWVDVSVKHRQTVDVPDRCGNLPKRLNLFLIGEALLEDCLALAFQPPEEEENKLLQVFYLEFRLVTQFVNIMFDDVLRLHVHLVQLVVLEEVAESRLCLLDVELVFSRVLPGRNKNYRLVESV